MVTIGFIGIYINSIVYISQGGEANMSKAVFVILDEDNFEKVENRRKPLGLSRSAYVRMCVLKQLNAQEGEDDRA